MTILRAACLLIALCTPVAADGIKWIRNTDKIGKILTSKPDKPILMLLASSDKLIQTLERTKTLSDKEVVSRSKQFTCILVEKSANSELWNVMMKAGFRSAANKFTFIDDRKLTPPAGGNTPESTLKNAARAIAWKGRASPPAARLVAAFDAFIGIRWGFKISHFKAGTRNIGKSSIDDELRLKFTNKSKVDEITLVYTALVKKGKTSRLIKREVTFEGPAVGKEHKTLAIYRDKRRVKYGRLVCGRVDIYLGDGGEGSLLLATATCGNPPKKEPHWYTKFEEIDDDKLTYKADHTWESKTLKKK